MATRPSDPMTRSASRYSWAAAEMSRVVAAGHAASLRPGPAPPFASASRGARHTACVPQASPTRYGAGRREPEQPGADPRSGPLADGQDGRRRAARRRARRSRRTRPRPPRARRANRPAMTSGWTASVTTGTASGQDAANAAQPVSSPSERRDGIADGRPADDASASRQRASPRASASRSRGRGPHRERLEVGQAARPATALAAARRRRRGAASGGTRRSASCGSRTRRRRSSSIGGRRRHVRRCSTASGGSAPADAGRRPPRRVAGSVAAGRQPRRRPRRRARAWYSGPCLRGSAYSLGLIVQ